MKDFFKIQPQVRVPPACLGHLHFIFCRFLPKRDIPVGQLSMQIFLPFVLMEQLAVMLASLIAATGSVGSQP